RQIPQSYNIKSCTISQSPSGKYYASILTEYEAEIQPVKVIEEDKVIGLDMDMKNLFTDSQGKVLVKVGKWYPSSKTCSVCGYEKAELSLNEREWECPNCHTIHDRDINAAINIKHQGLHMLGYDENRGAHGDSSLILSTEVLLSEKPPLL
ncbi:MAG: zinc ribbon domain-containing protein, partial [Athalassotoga sp.]|uniref:zinc ribbon domain-containing protein n=1 Tax=Athalassotoga sp. TaxID=2022597 RepID=UPI003D083FCD